jgi:ABC-type nitrate/sulfonate/bicarbonate transport system permease component
MEILNSTSGLGLALTDSMTAVSSNLSFAFLAVLGVVAVLYSFRKLYVLITRN